MDGPCDSYSQVFMMCVSELSSSAEECLCSFWDENCSNNTFSESSVNNVISTPLSCSTIVTSVCEPCASMETVTKVATVYPDTANCAAVNSREIAIYPTLAACIFLSILFGIVTFLMTCLYLKKKSKTFNPAARMPSDFGCSEFGRKLSLVQNTLRDSEEDTDISALNQTQMANTEGPVLLYATVHKPPKQPIPDSPSHPPPLPPEPEGNYSFGNDEYRLPREGDDVKNMYQELPGEIEMSTLPPESEGNYSFANDEYRQPRQGDSVEHMYQELPGKIETSNYNTTGSAKKRASQYEVPVCITLTNKEDQIKAACINRLN